MQAQFSNLTRHAPRGEHALVSNTNKTKKMKTLKPTKKQVNVIAENFNMNDLIAFAYLGSGLFIINLHTQNSDDGRRGGLNLVQVTGENPQDFNVLIPRILHLSSEELSDMKEVRLARAAYAVANKPEKIYGYNEEQQRRLNSITFFNHVFIRNGKVKTYVMGEEINAY